jgi:O-acetylhomoserine (thiol)-lyase
VLEERIAALEGGVAGIATASGQAACTWAAITIAGAGSHIVASRAVRRLAQPARLHPAPLRHRDHLRRSARPGRLARRHPPRNAVLFGETLGNPGLDVLDIPTIAASPTNTCR